MSLYKPGLTDNVKVPSDVVRHRFIAHNGSYATGGGGVRGVSKDGANAGEKVTLFVNGSCQLELEEAVTLGAEIMAGTTGKGKIATNSGTLPLGTFVSAIALEAGSIGETIEVRLVNYKI